MFDFLISIFDGLAGFALLFLGISYVEPVACDTLPDLLPIHYVNEETVDQSRMIDCAAFDLETENPNRVYLI